jgi:osmotically-inducible protein OsmY
MRYMTLVALAGAAFALAGCSQQQNAEAGNATKNAEKQLSQAADKAKHDITDGGITLKVKSAMNASDKLNTSAINVDTKDKVVHIRGAVADSNQKALAERIAKDTVGKDVQVVDELAVSPPQNAAKK